MDVYYDLWRFYSSDYLLISRHVAESEGYKMTTPKELVEAAMNLETVDRIPFCPPFQGYWALNLAGISVKDSITKPKLAAEAQFKVVESCNIGRGDNVRLADARGGHGV